MSPEGTQASVHAVQRVFDAQTADSRRLSSVFSVVLVPGCAALGPIELVDIEKLLELDVTVPGGTPVSEMTVSVVVVLEGLVTQDPVQSVAR